MAMELPNGAMITGKTSDLLGAASACLINALKNLAGVDKSVILMDPGIIQPIQKMKVEHLGNHNPRLHLDELLIALSICALTSEDAEKTIKALDQLKGSQAHSTVILSSDDINVLKKLGVDITFEPRYQVKKLYHK